VVTSDDYEGTLRKLALHDERFLAQVLSRRRSTALDEGLEPRTADLARLGALMALDAGAGAIEVTVTDALAAGATPEDIVNVLLAVTPLVGSARLMTVAPRVATGLGYDVYAALERLDTE
jgi:4-carboxymuconolactone decarboxylase